MTATSRTKALELARETVRVVESIPTGFVVRVDERLLAVARALIAADERCEQLEAELADAEASLIRMSEYRFALEGVPTDGKGNPLCQRWLSIPGDARCQFVWNHDGQCGLTAPDKESNDGG